MSKRSYNEEEAFQKRALKRVKVHDFYSKIDVYKVEGYKYDDKFYITTSDNNEYSYSQVVIKERSKSATMYEKVEEKTKTALIKLFSALSINDVWSAEFLTHEKDSKWHDDLVTKIREMDENEAKKYVKKKFTSFGKVKRELVGRKISPSSNNNYYPVRDLKIHSEALEKGSDVESAEKSSIRQLDVNSLQYLIFNGIKYVLK